MTDSYYEVVDAADPSGEKFRATDLVEAHGRRRYSMPHRCRHCWSGRSSAALQRDDTRLSRVAVDLLGPVPAEGLWVRSRVERPGKQIELVSAEMLAWDPTVSPGRQRGPAGGGCSSWTPPTLAHAAAPLPRPISEGHSRNCEKDWDRNYVHSLEWRWLSKPLSDGPGSRGCGPRSTWSTAR